MLDYRPFWGLIIWLNLCVVIWLINVQAPVLNDPGDVVLSSVTTSDQQQQPQFYGKHLLQAHRHASASVNMFTNGSSSEVFQLLSDNQTQTEEQQQQEETSKRLLIGNSSNKYQIHETNRHVRRLFNLSNLVLYIKRTPNPLTFKPTTVINSIPPATVAVRPTPWSVKGSTTDAEQLIDLHDFKYLMNQSPCTAAIKALILVHTAPHNIKKRQLIRQTWGSFATKPQLRLLFLLGAVSLNGTQQDDLERENAHFADMVQGSFQDNYRNMTYKHVMALKWFHYNCQMAQLLIKVDDDIYVNTPQLLQYLQALNAEKQPFGLATKNSRLHTILHQQSHDLLFCDRLTGALVKRTYRSKWRVSFAEYPARYYPPYCPGYAIIYSADVATKLYNAAQQAKYFWIDDVHITGVLAQRINITITNLKPYVLFGDDLDSLLAHKTDLDSIEFLFSWNEILPQQISALWTLHMQNTAGNFSSITQNAPEMHQLHADR